MVSFYMDRKPYLVVTYVARNGILPKIVDYLNQKPGIVRLLGQKYHFSVFDNSLSRLAQPGVKLNMEVDNLVWETHTGDQVEEVLKGLVSKIRAEKQENKQRSVDTVLVQ